MSSSESTFIQASAANPDWRVAIAEVRRQVESELMARALRHGHSAPLTLGLCYLTDYYAPAAGSILDELRAAFPSVSWIGTVGVGVATSGVEFFDEPALVLLVASLPRRSFRLFSSKQPLSAVATSFAAHTALVHADPGTPDLQELLCELSSRIATGYLFGGLSSSRDRNLHMADDVFSGGLSGVAFSPEVDVISRVTQGCQPIGPARRVTRAERNVVVSLDDKPALDCVVHDLGLDPAASDDELFGALADTLVGLSDAAEDVAIRRPGQFGTETVVRHIVGVDRRQKVLAVAERVEPGIRLAFCTRNREAARLDLVRVATEIRDDLESGPPRLIAGAVYVSCSGRGGPHFGGRHAELKIVRDALGDVPLAGFFAGGEIARDHLYGYTGVLSIFAVPNASN